MVREQRALVTGITHLVGERAARSATFIEGMPDPERIPPWLTEGEVDFYTAEFERTGFRGAASDPRSSGAYGAP